MDTLRKPFFGAALVLLVLTVSVEIGGGLWLQGGYAGNLCAAMPPVLQEDCDPVEINDLKSDAPGLAIAYLALVDGILLFSVGLMATALVIPQALQGRLQGVITLVFALLLLLASIVLVFVALAKLLLMVTLFLSAPFGTLAYFAMFAFFPRGGAATLLSGLMALKVAFAVCLVVAQQRFLQNRSLVLLILTALIATVLVSFLHGFVPLFLVSITDALAAIVVAILAIIWLFILLLGSIPAIVKAIL